MLHKDNQYFIHSLPNGLRIAGCRTDGNVTYIGVAVNAGSRDESSEHFGLAHFVEHTIFKGTLRRRSWHISNRMETVGGELNAYTSKEETVVYTNAPAGNEERALELLADLIANATFPTREIDREREVIIEEINSYLDSPADSVYDEFEEMAYRGSALAHNILGTPESVRWIASADCRAFLDRFYTPSNMVLYISSPLAPEKALKLITKHFSQLHFPKSAGQREVPPLAPPFDIELNRDGHQAHTIVGARTFARTDPRRFPLFLLNNYLGGPCMNSVLNQEMRDRRGLVYTVDSSVSLLSDTGMMMIYFGSDRASVKKCRTIIRNRLDALASSPLNARLFDSIRNQYIGQLIVSSDNRESSAMSLAKSLLYYDKIRDVRIMAEELRATTAEEMRCVAETVASNLHYILTLC